MKRDAVLRAFVDDGIVIDGPTHPLARPTWGEEEVEAACRVIRSGRTTMGEITRAYEEAFASYVGTRYAVACNSGSSANLLMVAAWTLRYGKGVVIVPALGWATSYAPFQQYGWAMRVVDIDRKTLNYDLSALWAANEDSGADLILAINVLGNPNDFNGFPRRARVLEDNCEALGARYDGRRTGSIGVMASHSTFFAHHICTMEGGVVTTDDEHFYHLLLSLRAHGWTRDLPRANTFHEVPSPWRFVVPGYNVRPTEVQSAIGLAQLGKLDGFVAGRRANAATCPFNTQAETRNAESSWYGFAMLADDVAGLREWLTERHVEHRPVLSGNFLRHPASRFCNYNAGPLPNVDYVEEHGLMIGNCAEPIDWSIIDGISKWIG
jgi:CDP-6-deoxy-D-xylo-4-hexulose-3-dehydrase